MSSEQELGPTYHYQAHFPRLTAEVACMPLFSDDKGDSDTKRFQLTLTSTHPILKDLIQAIGPLVVKWLPVILGGLLGVPTGNEPTPPSPQSSPSPAS